MSDRLFYPAALVLALLLVGFALVTPQGEGLRSPGPFGHAVHISDAAREDLKAEAAKLRKPQLQAPAATPKPAKVKS